MNPASKPMDIAEAIRMLASLDYRSSEPGEYLVLIASAVSRLLETDWSVVTLSETPGYDRILASSKDIGEAANATYSLHGTVTERVISSGQPLCVGDTTHAHNSGALPEGYRAYVGLPLTTSEGKTIGTICSFDKQPRKFNAEALQVASLFAERAATAIELFSTLQRLEAFSDKLEHEVQERTEELRRTHEKLVHKERLAAIGEFASMIVHEVRTPLSTMSMALEYFEHIDLDKLAAKRLSMALGESKRLGGLLKEILLYANLGSGSFEPVNLNSLVEETVASLHSSSPQTFGNIRLSLAEAQLQVHANADKLRQVIINLLGNACEASPTDESVHLEIAPIGKGETVLICVRNATAGDPLDTNRIMEPFYTTKSLGTGLGLAIVKGTVEALQGGFSIQQDENGEVQAEVTLPRFAS